MPRPAAIDWRARSSRVAAYLACHMRAKLDRIFEAEAEEGTPELLVEIDQLEEVDRQTTNKYAAYGTVIHFIFQAGVRAQFPGKPEDHAPDNETKEIAAQFFDGDVSAMQQQALARAYDLRETIDAVGPDGKPWLAELERKKVWLQGHIDLTAQDWSEFVDIKTTVRMPPNNRPKWEHVVQMVCYWLLLDEKPERARIVYIHSQNGQVIEHLVDFTNDDIRSLATEIKAFLKHIRTRRFLESPTPPAVGEQCSSNYCPYIPICKARYNPEKRVAPPAKDFAPPIMELDPDELANRGYRH